jgi:choloylglycine hydrolase
MYIKKSMSILVGLLLLLGSHTMNVNACTGIRLSAEDGSTVYGRTMEWGTFDLNTRVAIIPRGYVFTGLTPDGHNGRKW